MVLGVGHSLTLFVLAFGLGYIYQRTHRILPCIALHALYRENMDEGAYAVAIAKDAEDGATDEEERAREAEEGDAD